MLVVRRRRPARERHGVRRRCRAGDPGPVQAGHGGLSSEQIAGPLKGAPEVGRRRIGRRLLRGQAGQRAWISVRLHDGDLVYWRKRNGGSNPVALPEFGTDAFVNADFEGSTDLYAKREI